MCTKRRFASRPLAIQRVAEINKKDSSNGRKPIRAYYCGECGGYHLTSSDLRPEQKQVLKQRKENFAAKQADIWIKKKGWDID